jgi:hypothetical protein
MSNERIIVAAEPGTDWPLSLTDFADRLRGRWPDARTWTRHSPITNADYVAFEVGVAEQSRSGAYFPHRQLDLSDGTPEDWADTIAWFLRLLPATSHPLCLLSAVPEPTQLPRTSSPTEIAAILNGLNDR